MEVALDWVIGCSPKYHSLMTIQPYVVLVASISSDTARYLFRYGPWMYSTPILRSVAACRRRGHGHGRGRTQESHAVQFAKLGNTSGSPWRG